ncbi:hypothetical protein Scep_022850 [Stephania cephalantha]|uniref:Uncharacterized protein n=1 Tax=Stephania cephalantha TaxID=152367 RepID=A0AAP0I2G9_9MAGN
MAAVAAVDAAAVRAAEGDDDGDGFGKGGDSERRHSATGDGGESAREERGDGWSGVERREETARVKGERSAAGVRGERREE